MRHAFYFCAILVTTVLSTSACAQYNTKGTVHVALGIAGGAHTTEYETTTHILGIAVTDTEEDGAATFTVPIEGSYAFANAFSLGLYFEPGSYLDSSATESNALMLLGIQPRFYLVNSEHFAWMASLQLGMSALRIDRSELGAESSARYAGGNFGISTGVGFLFSDHFGIQVQARYMATNMPLKEYEVNGASIALDDFDAVLRTRGVAMQASATFKF
ncbi:MAG: hypothetical protein ABI432_03160 [Flavobacteriales bacterium]